MKKKDLIINWAKENDLTKVFEKQKNSFTENLKKPLNLANLKSKKFLNK